MSVCLDIKRKIGPRRYMKTKYVFYVRFYEKNNELYEVYFPVQLVGEVKRGNPPPGEPSIPSDFIEIKIILLMFTGSQFLFLVMYINFIIGDWEKC